MASLEQKKIENYFHKFVPNKKYINGYELCYSTVEMALSILNGIDKKNEYIRTTRTTIQISGIDTFDFGDKLGYTDWTKLLTLVENAILLKKLEIL